MDEDLEFPEWMIQYSQALKTVEKKKDSERNITRSGNFQVQGISGPRRRNLSERFQHSSARSLVSAEDSPENIKYQHLKERISTVTDSAKLQDDGISSLQVACDIAYECERLLNLAETLVDPLILGLDLDWPSTYAAFIVRTSSIHLCYAENSCLLFEVGSVKKLPVAFTKLIKHPNVRLLGHNIIEDLLKIGKDFEVDVKQVISSNLILSCSVGKKLSCEHRWSCDESDPLHQVYHQDLDAELGCSNSNTSSSIDYDDSSAACQPARFDGVLKYCTTFQGCAEYCEALLVRAAGSAQLVLGFDLEWPFSYSRGSGKVALIQICPDETICYLFHVFALRSLPKALVVLLTHPKVRLTGLNIANDIRKLGRDFNTDLSYVLKNNLIELCTLANRKLGCQHRWSLAGLVANQLKLDLDKGPVRVSNWSRQNLTAEQLQYAATDAYVAVFNVGRIAYARGLELQQSFADALKNSTSPWNGGALLLLEHSPVYTIGIRTKSYSMEDKARLESLGAEFHETNRGGLITFHGPGQLVAYPIINLKLWTPSVKWYIETLEDAVIDLCAKYDVRAHRYHPYPGIWVGEKKLCAVGVHASRFITTHGIAINCNTDMKWFEHIVPCGIEGKGVTSLSELLSTDVTVSDVITKFLDSFKEKFPCELIISPPRT